MFGNDIDIIGFTSEPNRPSNCRQDPNPGGKCIAVASCGNPPRNIEVCRRSGGWSSPLGKPFSFVVVAEVLLVGVEDCGVLEPELELRERRAFALSPC